MIFMVIVVYYIDLGGISNSNYNDFYGNSNSNSNVIDPMSDVLLILM